MKSKCRLVAFALFSVVLPLKAIQTNTPPWHLDIPEIIAADGKLRLDYGPEIKVLSRGLQPYMFCSTSGTIVVQAQVPEKPEPSNRQTFPSAMETRISRDDGKTWMVFPRPPGQNGLNLEGGAVQLHDGTILALDTYVTPGAGPDDGIGQLYTSTNDWRTLEGPQDVPFTLPNPNFNVHDDGDRPYHAVRVHRRIVQLPNGDLLTTIYGSFKGDDATATYSHSMKKSRVILVRSNDRGQHWKFVSVIAADFSVGTEGFDEPVLLRLSQGPHPGRLICLMRTGRELRETTSDDGVTWGKTYPRVFGDLDIYRTELWVDHFRHDKYGRKFLDENNLNELRGAVVDPDLIELRSGILVAAFGVRVPQKACQNYPDFPWNGNYLAFSLDHGETWSNVVRLTSGVLTTQYMAIVEMPTDNRIFVAYDLGGWGNKYKDVWGRFVDVTVK